MSEVFGQNPVKEVLDKLPFSDELKIRAWQGYIHSESKEQFQKSLEKAGMPKEAHSAMLKAFDDYERSSDRDYLIVDGQVREENPDGTERLVEAESRRRLGEIRNQRRSRLPWPRIYRTGGVNEGMIFD